jgi:hypothetical protein
MDARTIDRVMFGKGLVSDPAFQGLTFLIEPIPYTNGCPLGLYFHDTGLIWIPPEADESTLLHEVGHRYGDYYYHDLSEGFAEYFRMWYEQSAALRR